MRMQFAVRAENYVFTDDTKRSYETVGANLCFGMNDRSWMMHENVKLDGIGDHECDVCLADDLAIHGANAFGFADFTARFGEFDGND